MILGFGRLGSFTTDKESGFQVATAHLMCEFYVFNEAVSQSPIDHWLYSLVDYCTPVEL